jgi:hypothetical protein
VLEPGRGRGGLEREADNDTEFDTTDSKETSWTRRNTRLEWIMIEEM